MYISKLSYVPKLSFFSISEILDQVQEDAEDVLFSLGFGHEDHKDTSRIPARFFTNPSKAKGIDFQLFLKSQMERIEMEDPCLMLASEFSLTFLSFVTWLHNSWLTLFSSCSILIYIFLKIEHYGVCFFSLEETVFRKPRAINVLFRSVVLQLNEISIKPFIPL